MFTIKPINVLAGILKRFSNARKGNIALSFALALPVIALGVGLAVEVGSWETQKRRLQSAVDAAAIAGANEMYLNGTTKNVVASTVQTVGSANLISGRSPKASFATKVNDQDRTVQVHATQPRIQYLSAVLKSSTPPITAKATARAVGGGQICIIGLDESAKETIALTNRARLTAPDCAVYSNSLSKEGLSVKNSALLISGLLCTAGGAEGSKMVNYDPAPIFDCPQLQDPLRDRVPPQASGCKAKKLTIKGKNTTLYPGTYCDDLTITDGANVIFKSGIYIIKDGELKVTGDASITGQYVGFYFLGDKATFEFDTKSHVDLGAPKEGPMAGLLFFSDRNTKNMNKFKILSDDARNLLGTIYLPNGELLIDSKSPVADQSDYTVIVTRKLTLKEGPNLVINDDYGISDVPVPDGVGPVNSQVALAQ